MASWLVPRPLRRHVAAIYAFARTADDFADEGAAPAAERLASLAAWRERLHGRPAAGLPSDADDIFHALHDTIARFDLDTQLLDDLLTAFEQDVVTTRYETWAGVLDYCRRSANPVGRLVLALGRYSDPRALAQSDAVCTALQLTNFWQDFGRDWETGRLYVPADVLSTHGADTRDVEARRMSPAWQAVFTDLVDRTARLFDEGRGVADVVRGRLRYELRATWLGGAAVLARTAELRRASFDARPVLTKRDALRIARDVLVWRPASRRDCR